MEFMTRYECSRIIGVRASQLSMSAPTLAVVPKSMQHHFMYIAAIEMKRDLLDVIIRRPLPSNRFYEVHIRDLIKPDCLDTIIQTFESDLYESM